MFFTFAIARVKIFVWKSQKKNKQLSYLFKVLNDNIKKYENRNVIIVWENIIYPAFKFIWYENTITIPNANVVKFISCSFASLVLAINSKNTIAKIKYIKKLIQLEEYVSIRIFVFVISFVKIYIWYFVINAVANNTKPVLISLSILSMERLSFDYLYVRVTVYFEL